MEWDHFTLPEAARCLHWLAWSCAPHHSRAWSVYIALRNLTALSVELVQICSHQEGQSLPQLSA